MYVQVLMLALAVGAAPEPKNPALAEGIRSYKKLDYVGAIDSLQRALTIGGSRTELARVHVYYGLIQYLHGEVADAKSSFEQALRYDINVHLPNTAPRGAKAAVKQLRARMGAEAKAEAKSKGKEPAGSKPRPPKSGAGRDEAPERELARAEPVPPAEEAEPARALASAPGEGTASAVVAVSSEEDDELEPSPEPMVVATAAPIAREPRGRARALDPKTELPGVSHRATPAGVDMSQDFEPRSPSSPLPWVVLGTGGAAVTAGTVLAILATETGRSSHQMSLSSKESEARYDSAITQRTASIVAFGVGAVALSIGAWLLLSD